MQKPEVLNSGDGRAEARASGEKAGPLRCWPRIFDPF